MVENTPAIVDIHKPATSSANNESDEEGEVAMETNETEPPLMLDSISTEEIDPIIGSLEEASKVLVHAEHLIVSDLTDYYYLVCVVNTHCGYLDIMYEV